MNNVVPTARQPRRDRPPSLFSELRDAIALRDLPVMRSVRLGQVVRDEEYFRLAAGDARDNLSYRSAPVCNDAGAIVAAVLIEGDIRQKRCALRQLATLASAAEHTGLAVIGLDNEGRAEISVRRRDSALLVVEAIAFSTRGPPSGELTGYIAVHRDLGDDQRAARELTVGGARR